jgi:hypothetical protein
MSTQQQPQQTVHPFTRKGPVRERETKDYYVSTLPPMIALIDLTPEGRNSMGAMRLLIGNHVHNHAAHEPSCLFCLDRLNRREIQRARLGKLDGIR